MSKEFLQNAAVGLRGCPIVGFYDKAKQDFLGHERELTIDNGEFKYIAIDRLNSIFPTFHDANAFPLIDNNNPDTVEDTSLEDNK